MKRRSRAHRSGAGEFPEETLAAFRGCAENPDVQVDYFEFDLHMTADDVLVLSHDSTLDRVSDAVTVFGAENVLVRDKTLAELKDLNIAAQFVNDAAKRRIRIYTATPCRTSCAFCLWTRCWTI